MSWIKNKVKTEDSSVENIILIQIWDNWEEKKHFDTAEDGPGEKNEIGIKEDSQVEDNKGKTEGSSIERVGSGSI